MAVTGNEHDPQVPHTSRIAPTWWYTTDQDLARPLVGRAHERERQLGSAGAQSAGHAQNLAPADGETHVAQFATLQILDGECWRQSGIILGAAAGLFRWCDGCLPDIASDHEPDELQLVQVGNITRFH